MNAQEFKEAHGFEPIEDDLDRANCKLAGQIGHTWCGIYACCGRAKFTGHGEHCVRRQVLLAGGRG